MTQGEEKEEEVIEQQPIMNDHLELLRADQVADASDPPELAKLQGPTERRSIERLLWMFNLAGAHMQLIACGKTPWCLALVLLGLGALLVLAAATARNNRSIGVLSRV